jgi:plastocyanin
MTIFWQRRRYAAVLLGTLLLAGVGGSVVVTHGIAATSEQAAVTIDDFAFGPGTITVKRGATVTWTNKDDDAHTVVSAADPKLWKSGALDTDDHFSFTFNDPGTYKYICSVHPRMQGTVIVE